MRRLCSIAVLLFSLAFASSAQANHIVPKESYATCENVSVTFTGFPETKAKPIHWDILLGTTVVKSSAADYASPGRHFILVEAIGTTWTGPETVTFDATWSDHHETLSWVVEGCPPVVVPPAVVPVVLPEVATPPVAATPPQTVTTKKLTAPKKHHRRKCSRGRYRKHGRGRCRLRHTRTLTPKFTG